MVCSPRNPMAILFFFFFVPTFILRRAGRAYSSHSYCIGYLLLYSKFSKLIGIKQHILVILQVMWVRILNTA